MVTIVTAYKASDGSMYDTKEGAERHERIIDTRTIYNAVKTLMCDTQGLRASTSDIEKALIRQIELRTNLFDACKRLVEYAESLHNVEEKPYVGE